MAAMLLWWLLATNVWSLLIFALLFGADARLDLEANEPRGFVARITLPLPKAQPSVAPEAEHHAG